MITKSKKKHTGNFKQRAEFQYVTTTSDAMGGATEEWATLANDWVNIIPLSATQRLQMGAQGVSTTHTVQARYRDDLDTLTLTQQAIDYRRVVYDDGGTIQDFDAVNDMYRALGGDSTSVYDNKLRLVYNNRTFNIQYVINEDEESYYLEMAAEEWT